MYEDEHTLAFLDIHPVTRGHTLVVPKLHATNIFDISPESWAHVTEAVRVIAPQLEEALNANGINLMMNNREHAGQVIKHPHIHVIPRFTGDDLPHWHGGNYKDDEAQEVVDLIRHIPHE